jgi:hypothetical protein
MNKGSKVGIRPIALALSALALCGCQSSQHSQAQLAQICADPANRANVQGNLYYDECQALHPSTPSQLSKSYLQGAPQ